MDVASPSALPRKGVRSGLRAFVLVKHAEHGLLILEACKKRKGGRHFQLPGGHVDTHELEHYGESEGCRIAAARELYEETGMDFRDRLYRLSPVELLEMGPSAQPEASKLHDAGRRYFKLDISNADSVDDLGDSGDLDRSATGTVRLATPLSMEDFRLRLSAEHTGFRFEKVPQKASQFVAMHSGGTSSLAILLVEGRQAPEAPEDDS